MKYKGFTISGGYPIGSPMKVEDRFGTVLNTFPFRTTDEEIFKWIDNNCRAPKEGIGMPVGRIRTPYGRLG